MSHHGIEPVGEPDWFDIDYRDSRTVWIWIDEFTPVELTKGVLLAILREMERQ